MADVENLYDAVIVGGGPAGLTAALYLARARYRVLVVEKDHFGGQITITSEIVNYPGVFSTSGTALTETMQRQAEAFGAEFRLAEVTGFDTSQDIKVVHTTKGDINCFGILFATGASPRKLGFKGEAEFAGHGVAYCATCDGEFFTGKEVYVVGGGFAAAEESVFLTKYAKHVTVLVREDDFTCAPATAEPTKNHPKIDVKYHTQLLEVTGDTAVHALSYKDLKTGEVTHIDAGQDSMGVFVFVGYQPETALLKGVCELNDHGYVVTDEHHMTTADGIFAAGDVCIKPLRQVATAIGEAAQCATEMERYLKAAQEKTGLVPEQPERMNQKASSVADVAGEKNVAPADSLFDEAMVAQLNAVFSRMQQSITLQLHLDDSSVSQELKSYMEELTSLSDKVKLQEVAAAESYRDSDQAKLPYVSLAREDGTDTGLAFHGVPGGHEFTSFVLGLYNAAGPGQPIDEADAAAIKSITDPTKIKVIVGLSCTMCPEVVVNAQRIAADNPHVTADIFDINHYEDLKDRYNVMSVPCMVIEDADGSEHVSFGKKNLTQILELVK